MIYDPLALRSAPPSGVRTQAYNCMYITYPCHSRIFARIIKLISLSIFQFICLLRIASCYRSTEFTSVNVTDCVLQTISPNWCMSCDVLPLFFFLSTVLNWCLHDNNRQRTSAAFYTGNQQTWWCDNRQHMIVGSVNQLAIICEQQTLFLISLCAHQKK